MEQNCTRVAIQGEPGSNSHAAALAIAQTAGEPVPVIVGCGVSAEVFEALASGHADQAVLPIENSLHGSVAEHYDLLLEHPVHIVGEMRLRIRHAVMALPGVELAQVRRVLSHPVALSQCRRWLRAHPHIEAAPHQDTAGSIRLVMQHGLRDTAAIAPPHAASLYGAHILADGIEDHADNFTRFYTLLPGRCSAAVPGADKLSLAFALDHRPGALAEVLVRLSGAGLNLTRIESRPVPGRPWEYVFYVDLTFGEDAALDSVLVSLQPLCGMVQVLGRYTSAIPWTGTGLEGRQGVADKSGRPNRG